MNTSTRLMRSRDDRMIAGVCGGIARYLSVDPVIVRIVFVLLAFSGVSFLVYPLFWVVMPQEPARPIGSTPGQVFVAAGTPTQRIRFDPMTGQPLEPEQEIPINNVGPSEAAGGATTTPDQRGRVMGYLLLGLGGFIALQMFLPSLGGLLFPALLIGAGIYLLRRNP